MEFATSGKWAVQTLLLPLLGITVTCGKWSSPSLGWTRWGRQGFNHVEMAGILRIYLTSDPEKLWGTTLGHNTWWFCTDITVLTDRQRSVLAARSVHAVRRELGCLGLYSAGYAGQNCKMILQIWPHAESSTVRSLLFPSSCREKVVREQHHESEGEWPEEKGALHLQVLQCLQKYFSDLLQLIHNLNFKYYTIFPTLWTIDFTSSHVIREYGQRSSSWDPNPSWLKAFCGYFGGFLTALSS